LIRDRLKKLPPGETIGTATGVGLHPGPKARPGSWYLLLYVSFVLVTIACRPEPPDSPKIPRKQV
jgi:hypothetical protein